MKTLRLSLCALVTCAAAACVGCSLQRAPEGETGKASESVQAQRCGGNTKNALQCPPGYECTPDPTQPLPFGDVGGICQRIEIQHCGGNIQNPPRCPTGYECRPDPNERLPFGDVGGVCVKTTG